MSLTQRFVRVSHWFCERVETIRTYRWPLCVTSAMLAVCLFTMPAQASFTNLTTIPSPAPAVHQQWYVDWQDPEPPASNPSSAGIGTAFWIAQVVEVDQDGNGNWGLTVTTAEHTHAPHPSLGENPNNNLIPIDFDNIDPGDRHATHPSPALTATPHGEDHYDVLQARVDNAADVLNDTGEVIGPEMSRISVQLDHPKAVEFGTGHFTQLDQALPEPTSGLLFGLIGFTLFTRRRHL